MSLLENTLKQFLAQRLKGDAPVILALSGGSDSMALLHALKKVGGVNLHLAHVDHSWRSESAKEAAALERLATDLGFPFHLETLDTAQFEGNLEAYCREKRYQFFRRIAKDVGAQAVMLAHHSDDQAENALKGVLQGNALPFLGGMRSCGKIEGLQVWRPFLSLSKKAIVESLEEPAFDDVTNRDTKFLRARMRESIIPQLSESFGKEVSGALNRLSKQSRVLCDYLDKRIEGSLAKLKKGPFGACLPIDSSLPQVEMEHLIRRVCSANDIILPAAQVEMACQLLQAGVADRVLRSRLYIDRSSLFILKRPMKELQWEITVEETSQDLQSQSWRDLWERGEAWAILPEKEYRLAPAIMNEPYHQKSTISKWWGEHKIAAFLRNTIPVLWEGDRQQHEFLTGKCWFNKREEALVKVTITSPALLH